MFLHFNLKIQEVREIFACWEFVSARERSSRFHIKNLKLPEFVLMKGLYSSVRIHNYFDSWL